VSWKLELYRIAKEDVREEQIRGVEKEIFARRGQSPLSKPPICVSLIQKSCWRLHPLSLFLCCF